MGILANSVVFGGRPSKSEVYGFSCFGDHEGIVSLRNSSNIEKRYTLKLDEIIGVKKSFAFGEMYTLLPYNTFEADGAYSYGDSIEFILAPYQTKIVHFGKRNKELEITYCKALSEKKLLVTFNQFVNIESISSDNNTISEKELLEDYMSVILTFDKPFCKDNTVNICSVKGDTGIESDVKASFTYYENDIIDDGGIKGRYDFSVEINLTKIKEGTVYRQGDELEIYIGEDGFVRFKVGLCVLKSISTVSDAVQITAVRERNNVLKLYIDKNLDAGMPCVAYELSGALSEKSEGVNVKVFDKALAYDEV